MQRFACFFTENVREIRGAVPEPLRNVADARQRINLVVDAAADGVDHSAVWAGGIRGKAGRFRSAQPVPINPENQKAQAGGDNLLKAGLFPVKLLRQAPQQLADAADIRPAGCINRIEKAQDIGIIGSTVRRFRDVKAEK